MSTSERYLGDGVYASFDGYQIWLRTPREDGEHRIALEPEAFTALIAFQRALLSEQKAARARLSQSQAAGEGG